MSKLFYEMWSTTEFSTWRHAEGVRKRDCEICGRLRLIRKLNPFRAGKLFNPALSRLAHSSKYGIANLYQIAALFNVKHTAMSSNHLFQLNGLGEESFLLQSTCCIVKRFHRNRMAAPYCLTWIKQWTRWIPDVPNKRSGIGDRCPESIETFLGFLVILLCRHKQMTEPYFLFWIAFLASSVTRARN
jgi:hypothetical protein